LKAQAGSQDAKSVMMQKKSGDCIDRLEKKALEIKLHHLQLNCHLETQGTKPSSFTTRAIERKH